MSNVLYLPQANRLCPDCGCTKAVSDAAAWRDAVLWLMPVETCLCCGDRVEADALYASDAPESGVLGPCEICGDQDLLVGCLFDQPDGKRDTRLLLCADCVDDVCNDAGEIH